MWSDIQLHNAKREEISFHEKEDDIYVAIENQTRDGEKFTELFHHKEGHSELKDYSYIIESRGISEWEYWEKTGNSSYNWHYAIENKIRRDIERCKEKLYLGNFEGEEEKAELEKRISIRVLELSIFDYKMRDVLEWAGLGEKTVRRYWDKMNVNYGEYFGVFIEALIEQGYGTEDIEDYMIMIGMNPDTKELRKAIRERAKRHVVLEKRTTLREIYGRELSFPRPSNRLYEALWIEEPIRFELVESGRYSAVKTYRHRITGEEITVSKTLREGKGYVFSMEQVRNIQIQLKNQWRAEALKLWKYDGVNYYFRTDLAKE